MWTSNSFLAGKNARKLFEVRQKIKELLEVVSLDKNGIRGNIMTRPETTQVIDDVEPLLEQLLTEVVTGTRMESKGHNGDSLTAALTEAAMASFSRAVSQASGVERALLVEALAPALAEALAPALAKALAPEIVTALGHLATTPESAEESESAKSEHREQAPGESAGEESPGGDAGSGKGKKSRD